MHSGILAGSGASGSHRAHIHLFDRREQPPQPDRLGVVPLIVSTTPAVIRLAGDQHLLEALRAAIRVRALKHVDDGPGAQLVHLVHHAVVARHDPRQLAEAARGLEPRAQSIDEVPASLLVPPVTRKDLLWSGSLAQIVGQGCEGDLGIRRKARSHVQDHHGMDPGVDLGVPLLRLGDAEETVHLRKQPGQGAAFAQDLEEPGGFGPIQGLGQLLPYPLGYQGVHLTAVHHGAHQGHGLVCDSKTQVCVSGSKSRYAQDAHRVFRKGVGDMTQHPVLQIRSAAVEIDEIALLVPRQGVDCEIATAQILLQGHIGIRVDDEAAIAGGRLALGSRQGVFLFGFGVQKDRKVTAHLLVTTGDQVLGAGPHDDIVPLVDGPAEQGVAHRSADEIDPHDSSLAVKGSYAADRVAFPETSLPGRACPYPATPRRSPCCLRGRTWR